MGMMYKADVCFHLSFIGRCQALEILEWRLTNFDIGTVEMQWLSCTEWGLLSHEISFRFCEATRSFEMHG